MAGIVQPLDYPDHGAWLERQLDYDSFSRFPDWVVPFARIAWRKGGGGGPGAH